MHKPLIKSDDDPNKWFYQGHTIVLMDTLTYTVINDETGVALGENQPSLQASVDLIDEFA